MIPLAALISGIVGRTSPPLPPIAAQVPNGTTPASRVKRCARWCDNAHLLEAGSLLPSAEVLRRHLAVQTVGRVMDGRGVGRGGPALRIPVVDTGRALPLAWRVRQAPQGHLPADRPSALVPRISALISAGTQGVWLGDGAVDGTRLQPTLQQAGWSSACRTAPSPVAPWERATCRLGRLGACLKPGRRIEWKDVHGTREAYGPIMVRCCWAQGDHEPRSVVSQRATAAEACRL